MGKLYYKQAGDDLFADEINEIYGFIYGNLIAFGNDGLGSAII